MEEAIRVCIRQRPLFPKETEAGHVKAWKLSENGALTLEISPPQGIPIKRAYAFDMCFDDHCKNQEIYEKTARDIVRDTAKGINGCYMAYGQTGCGKTHSIMGTAEDPGVLPRAVAELFDLIEDGSAISPDEEDCETVRQYLQDRAVYAAQRVNDLFQDGPKGESQPLENLDVKEDPKGGFYVVGLAEREVSSIDDVMKLLQSAEMKRHFASTNFNETSSRSHTVFTTILESTQTYRDGSVITRRGELKLVDLAGNERATAAEGLETAKERLAEGQAINKSLFLLSEVIAKLSKRAELLKKGAGAAADKVRKDMLHIPWRDSKLTRLLQKALGGNSRACLLVAVHPSTQALEISLSTLRFALKTKQIKKKIVQNFVSAEQSMIMQQKETIKRLQQQLMALQELTGVEAPLVTTVGEEAAPRVRTIRVVESAPTNETIEKLKQELQSKVDALSKLILHAKFESKDVPSDIPAKFARSVTVSGLHDRFRRLRTLPENMQRQLYIRPVEDLDDVEDSHSKSIAGTLKYLRNITAMNEQATSDQGIKKDEAATMKRYDTVLLDKSPPLSDADSTSEIQKRIIGLKLQNSRLLARNKAYVAHANYMKALFQKLGLSLLVTSTDVTSSGGRPALSYSLASPGYPSTTKHQAEESFTRYIQEIQPLASAMLSKILCNAINRQMTSKNDDASTLEQPTETALTTSKNEYKIDSIFALLSPWEQHVLALFYEQDDVRSTIRQLTHRFTDEIGELQQRIQNLMAEKIELVEHSTRLIEELREFRYGEIPKGESGMNETFGRLLKRMDALSMELAERTAESKTLRAEYLDTVKERDDLQKIVEEMKMRHFSIDLESIPDDFSETTFNEDSRRLLRETLLSRHLAAEASIRLEESRNIERDLRVVNQQLWKELRAVQSSLESVRNEKKLVGFELKNERATLQKKLEESYATCKLVEADCAKLKRDLAEMTAKYDAVVEKETRRVEEQKEAAAKQDSMLVSSNAQQLPTAAKLVGRGRPNVSYGVRSLMSRPQAGIRSRVPLNKNAGLPKVGPILRMVTPQLSSLSKDSSTTRDLMEDAAGASSPSPSSATPPVMLNTVTQITPTVTLGSKLVSRTRPATTDTRRAVGVGARSTLAPRAVIGAARRTYMGGKESFLNKTTPSPLTSTSSIAGLNLSAPGLRPSLRTSLQKIRRNKS